MGYGEIWMLVIAMTALTGWWLSCRESSSYRGVSGQMSGLIMVLAVLMCVLAWHGQSQNTDVIGVALGWLY